MATYTAHHGLSRTKFLLLAGLMVLSSLLFVAGVALERSSPSSEETSAPTRQAAPLVEKGREAQEGTEAREAQERQEAGSTATQESAEGNAAHEQAERSGVFGIDLESPWVLAGVVLGTLLLIAALFLFGYRVLLLVLFVVLATTIFDVREVILQLGRARYGIAALAGGVAISRLATIIVAWFALRERRRSAHPPVAPSHSTVP